MKTQRDSTRLRRNYWMEQATRAEAALQAASDTVASLEKRNQLLTDLIGGRPVLMIPRVGQRVIGPEHRLGTVTGLSELRGEQVVYVLWDEPRARDVVPLSTP